MNESETPRTDSAKEWIHDRGMTEWIPAELSGAIETELAAANFRNAELKDEIAKRHKCESGACGACQGCVNSELQAELAAEHQDKMTAIELLNERGEKLTALMGELAASKAREKRLGESLEHQSTAWGLYGDESKSALEAWRAAK